MFALPPRTQPGPATHDNLRVRSRPKTRAPPYRLATRPQEPARDQDHERSRLEGLLGGQDVNFCQVNVLGNGRDEGDSFRDVG